MEVLSESFHDLRNFRCVEKGNVSFELFVVFDGSRQTPQSDSLRRTGFSFVSRKIRWGRTLRNLVRLLGCRFKCSWT